MKISTLAGNPRNPRKISDRQLKSLTASLEKFGDLAGIFYNRRTKRFGGGHQRAKALPADAEVTIERRYDKPTRTGTVAEGFITAHGERFTYREVDWAPDFEEAANIAANKQGGEWDEALLGEVMADLSDELRSLTGFTDEEIENLLPKNETEGLTDPDEVPEPPKVAKTKRGELWLLDPYWQCEACGKEYAYDVGSQMKECPCG